MYSLSLKNEQNQRGRLPKRTSPKISSLYLQLENICKLLHDARLGAELLAGGGALLGSGGVGLDNGGNLADLALRSEERRVGKECYS